jgi:hypothetical protein
MSISNNYSYSIRLNAIVKAQSGDPMSDRDAEALYEFALEMAEKLDAPSGPKRESDDEWYERERAAFIAWWESEGQKQFSDTPTLAAGAGWLARADRVSPATRSGS